MTLHQSTKYAAIFLLVLASACNNKESSNEVQSSAIDTSSMDVAQKEIVVTKKQFESLGLTLGQITEQNLTKSIRSRGYIEVPPTNKISVSPYHGGYIKNINVLPGEVVKKGQVLFTIENPEFIQLQQAFLVIKEQLDYLKSDFTRQQTLAKENIASQKNFLKAESEYKVMMAKYLGLKGQLKLINIPEPKIESTRFVSQIAIYAPLSGHVTKVNTNKGAYVNASDMVVELTNIDHLHLELQVFEKDILNIKEGQEIVFRIPEFGVKTFEATVFLVGKSIEEKERTVNVHGHLHDDEKNNFIPGMYVEAEIVVEKVPMPCLPASAIVEHDGTDFILVLSSETEERYVFKQVDVLTGRKGNEQTEILNKGKFNTDAMILTKGAFNLIVE